jgi:hypothetical protein
VGDDHHHAQRDHEGDLQRPSHRSTIGRFAARRCVRVGRTNTR